MFQDVESNGDGHTTLPVETPDQENGYVLVDLPHIVSGFEPINCISTSTMHIVLMFTFHMIRKLIEIITSGPAAPSNLLTSVFLFG